MIIKNGFVVSSDGIEKKDIIIRNGKIVTDEINPGLSDEVIIDASGKYILPGGVDVHTHMNLDAGIAVASDDFTQVLLLL